MPMPCNPGTTIIDNLVICFLAAPTLLAELRDLFGIDCGDFRLSRIEGRFHRHYFNITTPRAQKLGSLYFDRFASDGNERYIWLKVENAALYDRDLIDEVRRILDRLGLQYYGISSLDLARDFGYDVASRIRKMMRREDLAVIINGKEVKNRTTMLKGIYRTCGMSLVKDGTKGLTIKQAKAARNKHLGITLDCYNKTEEIENASGKQYISDFYGQRKRLHRLEVRLNCEQIKRACSKTGVAYELNLLETPESLDALFIYTLQSVLRFRRGRKVLQWEDLFKCGVR